MGAYEKIGESQRGRILAGVSLAAHTVTQIGARTHLRGGGRNVQHGHATGNTIRFLLYAVVVMVG